MLLGLWLSRNIAQIRTVMVVGSSALLIAAVALTVGYLQARAGGDTAEMLFRADTVWYAPLHIAYSVGVDGISVAMLLLSAVIVSQEHSLPGDYNRLLKNIFSGSLCCQWEYSGSLSRSTFSPCSCSTKSH